MVSSLGQSDRCTGAGVWDKAVKVWASAAIDIGYHQGRADGFLDANPSAPAQRDQRRGRLGRIMDGVFKRLQAPEAERSLYKMPLEDQLNVVAI